MTTAEQNQTLDLDTKLLAEFIYALNIARRQILSYPVGHPIVVSATAKLIEVVPRLLEFRKMITLGVARDTLMFEGGALDAADPVFKDLASNLFDARIASLTVARDLTEEEILRFFEIFKKSSEQLAEEGGIGQAVKDAGLRGVSAQGIDFSAFSTTEVDVVHASKMKAEGSDAALLWKSFANGIVAGSIDPDGVRYAQRADLDPVLLAEIMNREQWDEGSSVETSYEEAITTFINQADQGKLGDEGYQNTLGRLGDMVGKLKPDLRRKFLNSTLKSCAHRPDNAEAFLKNLPQTALLDAFEQMDVGAVEIPQTLMDVIGKLSAHRGDEISQSRVVGESNRSSEETAEHLTMLFSEDRSEYYVPRDYQEALAVLAVAKVDHSLEKRQQEALLSSLGSHDIDGQFSTILLDLMGRGVDPLTGEAIVQNLDELVDYFLETGDVDSLSSIYVHLCHQKRTPSVEVVASAQELLDRFADKEFVEVVLDGFDTWGKTVHESVLSLIGHVGSPFAEALLDRLADEASMSRRRLLMAGLVRIGTQVQDPVAARLKDSRWYFVRNLVVILREINDSSVVSLLSRLSRYKHPKVQFEVMKTYLHFGDDRANRFLVKELSGKNPVALLSAVRLAANSRDRRVVNMLAKVLNKRLSPDHELEIKNNVIKALNESATEEILPELADFLFGKKMFGASRSESLKVPVVNLLGKIGSVEAGIMAGKVAQSTTGELAKAAEAVLAEIHRKLT